MKLLVSLLITFLLTGCAVANMDSTGYTSVRYAQTFQKKDQIGYTNTAQRKVDLYACGVDKMQNLDDDSWSRGAAAKGEGIQQVMERIQNLENCMTNKGYVIFSYAQCGPLKAPTGLCN